MPSLENNVLNNNENSTNNRKISVTVRRKGKPEGDENNTVPFVDSTEPLVASNVPKIEKDTLEINTLPNTYVENTNSSILGVENTNSSIFGVVTDIRGLPVKDAIVQLKTLRSDSYITINEVLSNSSGEYLFINLPIGIYSLNIYKDGFINYQSTNININFKESIGLNIQLKEDLRNHLGSIHGIIKDESTNLPLEDILVALYSVINSTELLISSTFTNKEGQYSFNLIPPGNYIIKAAASRKEET